jgi:hypothetical protein
MVARKNRKMPRHIVLPNGMWRFIKGKSQAKSRVSKRHRVYGGGAMARRKVPRRSRGGFGGQNKWVNIALWSGGAAFLAPKVLGGAVSPNIAGALGGWKAGGLMGGAIGYVAGPMLANVASGTLGGLGGASTNNGVKLY